MTANRSGHIVNITASVAIQPNIKVPAVLPVMVKGGLNAATRALALIRGLLLDLLASDDPERVTAAVHAGHWAPGDLNP